MTGGRAGGTGVDDAATGAERARRRAVRAWCLYDVGNSAFATSAVAAILPVWFAGIAGRVMPAHDATALWGYASSLAMLAAAVAGP